MGKLKSFTMSLAVLFPVLFLAEISWAATYYVATNGNDSNAGTIDRPFATINKGASVLGPGDTLYIRGGTYNQTVYVGNSGTASAPITISSYPGEWAVIDGQDTLPASDWGVLFNVYGNYVLIQDLTVKNSNWMGLVLTGHHDQAIRVKSHRNKENGILVTGDYGLVESCEVYYNCKSNENFSNTRGNWASGLSAARHPYYATIRNNKVWNNWGEGLSTYEAEHTTIEDNQIWDNKGNVYISDTKYTLFQRNLVYVTPGNSNNNVWQANIGFQDETQNPASSNNTIINNMFLGGKPNLIKWVHPAYNDVFNNVLIANNTFVNAQSYRNIWIDDGAGAHINSRFINNIVLQEDSLDAIYVALPTGITFSNNLWSKAPSSAASGSGDIIGDPKLTKTGSTGPGQLTPDWFKLLSNSPAINKAAVLSEVTEDFFKTARGSSPDIGAHEYTGTPPSDTTPPSPPTGVRIR